MNTHQGSSGFTHNHVHRALPYTPIKGPRASHTITCTEHYHIHPSRVLGLHTQSRAQSTTVYTHQGSSGFTHNHVHRALPYTPIKGPRASHTITCTGHYRIHPSRVLGLHTQSRAQGTTVYTHQGSSGFTHNHVHRALPHTPIKGPRASHTITCTEHYRIHPSRVLRLHTQLRAQSTIVYTHQGSSGFTHNHVHRALPYTPIKGPRASHTITCTEHYRMAPNIFAD